MKDKIYKSIANILPNLLIYYCTKRAVDYSTQGKNKHSEFKEIKAETVLIRWYHFKIKEPFLNKLRNKKIL